MQTPIRTAYADQYSKLPRYDLGNKQLTLTDLQNLRSKNASDFALLLSKLIECKYHAQTGISNNVEDVSKQNECWQCILDFSLWPKEKLNDLMAFIRNDWLDIAALRKFPPKFSELLSSLSNDEKDSVLSQFQFASPSQNKQENLRIFLVEATGEPWQCLTPSTETLLDSSIIATEIKANPEKVIIQLTHQTIRSLSTSFLDQAKTDNERVMDVPANLMQYFDLIYLEARHCVEYQRIGDFNSRVLEKVLTKAIERNDLVATRKFLKSKLFEACPIPVATLEILIKAEVIPNVHQELQSRIRVVKDEIAKLKVSSELLKIDEEQNRSALGRLAPGMKELVEFAQKYQQLNVLLNDTIQDLKSWLISTSDFEHKSTLLLPALTECACSSSNNFNRFSNSRRERIESSVIDFVKTRFPNPEIATINYLELGGGGLLQTYILAAKLILAGYKNINVYLVDPAHGDGSAKKPLALQQLETLLLVAKEMNITLDIQRFSSMDSYNTRCNVQADVVTAIDFDDFYRKAFDDTMKAQQILHPEGRMFLSVAQKDFVFASDKCLSTNNTHAAEIVKELPVKGTKKVQITHLLADNLWTMLQTVLIPYMQKCQAPCEIVLTLPRPQEVNSFGDVRGHQYPNNHISAQNLQRFASFFLPAGVHLKVNYVTGYEDFSKLLPQIPSNQDMVICFPRVITVGSNKALASDITALHHRFSQASIFCGMKVFESASVSSLSFAAEWLWNHETKAIKSLGDSSSSFSSLEQFYAENFGGIKNEQADLTSSS